MNETNLSKFQTHLASIAGSGEWKIEDDGDILIARRDDGLDITWFPGESSGQWRAELGKFFCYSNDLATAIAHVRHSVKCFSTISSVQQKQENHR